MHKILSIPSPRVIPHLTIPNKLSISWDKLVAVTRSDRGDDGVYFVVGADGHVVLKATETPGPEIFLTLLKERLGFSGPKTRYVTQDSAEGKKIRTYLKPFVEASNAALVRQKKQNPDDTEIQERKFLDLNHITVFSLMEFVHGRSLADTVQHHFETWFGVPPEINKNGEAMFKKLGELLIFDILIRNNDRFWLGNLPGFNEDTLGNLGNLMFYEESGALCVIDSTSNYLEDSDEYAAQVQLLLEDLSQKTSNCDLVKRGRFFIEESEYMAPKAANEFIFEGLRTGIDAIRSLDNHEIDRIMRETVEHTPTETLSAKKLRDLICTVLQIIKTNAL